MHTPSLPHRSRPFRYAADSRSRGTLDRPRCAGQLPRAAAPPRRAQPITGRIGPTGRPVAPRTGQRGPRALEPTAGRDLDSRPRRRRPEPGGLPHHKPPVGHGISCRHSGRRSRWRGSAHRSSCRRTTALCFPPCVSRSPGRGPAGNRTPVRCRAACGFAAPSNPSQPLIPSSIIARKAGSSSWEWANRAAPLVTTRLLTCPKVAATMALNEAANGLRISDQPYQHSR
jgi:hypothetical protein